MQSNFETPPLLLIPTQKKQNSVLLVNNSTILYYRTIRTPKQKELVSCTIVQYIRTVTMMSPRRCWTDVNVIMSRRWINECMVRSTARAFSTLLYQRGFIHDEERCSERIGKAL
jgi:hypothetical protein